MDYHHFCNPGGADSGVAVLAGRARGICKDAIAAAEEDAAQLKLQLETVRYRTSRLREELQAADRQARLSHQLTLLGQFTAGFMHEFNNPLAIVAGRIEVLLEERKADAELCSDLEQMLKETRYNEQHCEDFVAGLAS